MKACFETSMMILVGCVGLVLAIDLMALVNFTHTVHRDRDMIVRTIENNNGYSQNSKDQIHQHKHCKHCVVRVQTYETKYKIVYDAPYTLKSLNLKLDISVEGYAYVS